MDMQADNDEYQNGAELIPVIRAHAEVCSTDSRSRLMQMEANRHSRPTRPCLPGQSPSLPSRATTTAFASSAQLHSTSVNTCKRTVYWIAIASSSCAGILHVTGRCSPASVPHLAGVHYEGDGKPGAGIALPVPPRLASNPAKSTAGAGGSAECTAAIHLNWSPRCTAPPSP